MTETLHDIIPQQLLKDNVIDKAANSATRAVDATKQATNAALDSVADKVEGVRSTLSPALDRATAPFDSVVGYTRQQPLMALAGALAAGFVLHALLRPARRIRR